jgi:hypothetical protein
VPKMDHIQRGQYAELHWQFAVVYRRNSDRQQTIGTFLDAHRQSGLTNRSQMFWASLRTVGGSLLIRS